MRSLMAEDTVYPTVIRNCLSKIPGFLDVANLAECRRNPTVWHNLKGAVGRMAA